MTRPRHKTFQLHGAPLHPRPHPSASGNLNYILWVAGCSLTIYSPPPGFSSPLKFDGSVGYNQTVQWCSTWCRVWAQVLKLLNKGNIKCRNHLHVQTPESYSVWVNEPICSGLWQLSPEEGRMDPSAISPSTGQGPRRGRGRLDYLHAFK